MGSEACCYTQVMSRGGVGVGGVKSRKFNVYLKHQSSNNETKGASSSPTKKKRRVRTTDCWKGKR